MDGEWLWLIRFNRPPWATTFFKRSKNTLCLFPWIRIIQFACKKIAYIINLSGDAFFNSNIAVCHENRKVNENLLLLGKVRDHLVFPLSRANQISLDQLVKANSSCSNGPNQTERMRSPIWLPSTSAIWTFRTTTIGPRCILPPVVEIWPQSNCLCKTTRWSMPRIR